MNERLQALSELADETRAKKGRMDADARRRAAQLIYEIWSNPDEDHAASLPHLADLKAEAVADGISGSWAKMGLARQTDFARWVPVPAAERDVRRIAYLIGAFLDGDAAMAVRWLNLLAPASRGGPNRDARQHLAASLFGAAEVDLRKLALATTPAEALRLYSVLWSIASDQNFSVPKISRIRLARAVFSMALPAADGRALADAAALRDRIREDGASFPKEVRDELDGYAAAIEGPPASPDARGPVQPRPVPAAITVTKEPPAPSVPAPAAASSTPPSTVGAHSQSRKPGLPQIAEIQSQLEGISEAFEQIGRVAADANSRSETTTKDLAASRAEIVRLTAAQTSLVAERDRLSAESTASRATIESLRAELLQASARFEAERRRLGEQISSNASARLEEYRTRVALSLGRLVRDLPASDSPVSQELGAVLLLQFHQFLDAMRQEGIVVPRG